MKKKYQSLNLKPEAFAKIAASVRRAAKNANALSTSVKARLFRKQVP